MTVVNGNPTGERLVLTTSRSVVTWSLALFVATAALGLWFIKQSGDAIETLWSWVGVICLAAAAGASVLALVRPPKLILTTEGFHLTGPLSPGLIPWSEVEGFSLYSEAASRDADGQSVGGVAPHAVWRLKEGSSFSGGLASRLNRAGDVPIDGSFPRNIGLAPEPLSTLLEQWRIRYG